MKKEESRRQKQVSSVIKETLGLQILETFRDSINALVTVSKVEMTKDLKKAYIYLSFFGQEDKDLVLTKIKNKSGYLRKTVASKTKLKYNPELIFFLDLSPEYEEKIDRLIKAVNKDEKKTG
jgi:ribosome-binding factor A